MKRRTMLGCVATGTVLAGCQSTGRSFGLRRVFITSALEKPVTAAVEVKKDDEIRYDAIHTFDAADPTRADSVEIIEDWMGDRVSYEVTISVDADIDRSSATSRSDSLDVSNSEISCFEVNAVIATDGISIAHEYVESCDLD